MSDYEQVFEDEWGPLDRETDLACCDCGLVHTVTVRKRRGKLEVKFARNERATGQRRRWRGLAAIKRQPDGRTWEKL